MKTKFTPGPWRYERGSVLAGEPTNDIMEQKQVAHCHFVFGNDPDIPAILAEERANARLIATAPELVALLASFIERHDRCLEDPEEWNDIEQLAEATDIEAGIALLKKAGVE